MRCSIVIHESLVDVDNMASAWIFHFVQDSFSTTHRCSGPKLSLYSHVQIEKCKRLSRINMRMPIVFTDRTSVIMVATMTSGSGRMFCLSFWYRHSHDSCPCKCFEEEATNEHHRSLSRNTMRDPNVLRVITIDVCNRLDIDNIQFMSDSFSITDNGLVAPFQMTYLADTKVHRSHLNMVHVHLLISLLLTFLWHSWLQRSNAFEIRYAIYTNTSPKWSYFWCIHDKQSGYYVCILFKTDQWCTSSDCDIHKTSFLSECNSRIVFNVSNLFCHCIGKAVTAST